MEELAAVEELVVVGEQSALLVLWEEEAFGVAATTRTAPVAEWPHA